METYAALTLERIAAGADARPSDPLPEFVYLVLYHGDGPWHAPDHVTDLFERSDPGRFLLVSWKDEEGFARPRNDITALVLGLARNLSPEDMAEQVAALRRRVEERGDARLGAFLADRVMTMLELRGYTQELQLGGAKTMDELDDRFQRGLDELVQRGRGRVAAKVASGVRWWFCGDRSPAGSARRRRGRCPKCWRGYLAPMASTR